MAITPLSPASRPATASSRIPMSAPQQKLEVPEIPGYKTHWFKTGAGRIERAMAAGYEFVDPDETLVRSISLGNTAVSDGNTDLGSRVSIAAGGVGDDGQPIRLILMKIKQEWYEEDRKARENRVDQTINGLMGGNTGAGGGDQSNRYVDRARTQMPDFFNSRRRRSA